MDHSPLTSSNLKSAAYDPQKRELHVKFKSGKTFVYSGVDYAVHAKLLMAQSAGKFFNSNIRDRYNAKEVI